MKVALARSAWVGLLAFALAFSLFVSIGAFRLWPRISGQHLPFSLIWPFARPLLAAGLELSFLVSVPVALSLAGSLRSARAAGASSFRAEVLSVGLLVTGLGAFSFGVSARLDGSGSSPGQLAQELVASARESCTESQPPAEVGVPLLGFSWVCEPGRAPRLQGRAPLGKDARFQAAAIALGDDLKRISLEGFSLAFPTPAFQVQVRANRATLSGLPPWGRSRRMPLALRAGLFVSSVTLSALGLARLVALLSWLPAWGGALLGAMVSGCLWGALSWLERQEPRAIAYVVLPAAGACAVLLSGSMLVVGWRLHQRRARARSNPAVS